MFYVQNQIDKHHRFKWSYNISVAPDYSNVVLQIEPQLLSGKNVMIAAHGNSLRSIIMYLDKLTSQEVTYIVCYWDFLYFCGTLVFNNNKTNIMVTVPPLTPLFSFFWQVISLELSTGIPMLYIFKEGKFIRRGSPVAPTEAGVYAYTRVCNFCFLFFFLFYFLKIFSAPIYFYFIF